MYVLRYALRRSIIVLMLSLMPFTSQANPEREFIMSCTYGVLAGTLVGAATLAFVDNPSDNLQRVARGASLGLYAGIMLGLYTVYYLPKQLEKKNDIDPSLIGEDPYSFVDPKFQVQPLVLEDGAGALLSYRF
jgi:hypothetical protein